MCSRKDTILVTLIVFLKLNFYTWHLNFFVEVLGEVSLKEKISFATLNQYIYDIIEQIKSKYSEERNEKHALTTYMVDPSWTELDVSDTYSKMTSETVDVLESPDCAKVIEQCIHTGVEEVLKILKNSFCGCEGIVLLRALLAPCVLRVYTIYMLEVYA